MDEHPASRSGLQVDFDAGQHPLPPAAPAPVPRLDAAPPDASEARLLARLRAGDEAAFEDLVRANSPRMLRVARRILHSEDEARDAVQEAFLRAFQGLARFEGQARLSTWLHRIVVNACLMQLRSRRRHPELALAELLPKFHEDGHRVEPGAAWPPSALAELESARVRARVRAEIERLPEDYRNVLLMRDIHGMDTEEVATTLGITAGAVRVRLHRARMALRTLLEPYLASGETS